MGGGLMQLSERLNEMADAHKGMISAPLIMKGGSRRARTHRRTRRGGGRKKVAMTNRRTKKGGLFYFPRPRSHGF